MLAGTLNVHLDEQDFGNGVEGAAGSILCTSQNAVTDEQQVLELLAVEGA